MMVLGYIVYVGCHFVLLAGVDHWLTLIARKIGEIALILILAYRICFGKRRKGLDFYLV